MDTLADVLELLKGLPMDTVCHTIDLEEADFIILVDSNGNAQRVVSKRTRWLTIILMLPMHS